MSEEGRKQFGEAGSASADFADKPEFCKAKFARRAAGQNLEEILRFRRGNPGILRARICA